MVISLDGIKSDNEDTKADLVTGKVPTSCDSPHDPFKNATTESKPSSKSLDYPSVSEPSTLSSQRSEFAIYKYYTRTLGRFNTIVFVALCAALATTISFPRKIPSACNVPGTLGVKREQKSGSPDGYHRTKMEVKADHGIILRSTWHSDSWQSLHLCLVACESAFRSNPMHLSLLSAN